MLTRTGERIAISVIHRDGTRNILDEKTIRTVSGGIRQLFMPILSKTVRKMRLKNLYLLGAIFMKKYVLNTPYDEWNELMDWYHDFDHVEVEYRGRTLKFVAGGAYLPFILDGIFVRNQYDVSDYIKDYVVADCGANVGTFAVLCAFLGAKKVYAFEPVKSSCEMIRRNAEINGFSDIIEPVHMAVGDTNATMELNTTYGGDGGATLDKEMKRNASVEQVKVTTLDSFFGEKQVDFIKMDVEGFERQTLNGATKIIKNYHPIIAMSAYHKPDDKTVLPETLKNIDGTYSMKLLNYDDEVFYCAVRDDYWISN